MKVEVLKRNPLFLHINNNFGIFYTYYTNKRKQTLQLNNTTKKNKFSYCLLRTY